LNKEETLSGHNFIGNRASSEGMITFHSVNPVTGERGKTTFYEATKGEVDRAAIKADAIFSEYKAISNEDRATFLETIADEILNLGDELVNVCMSETALPEGRIIGERGRTMNQLRLFANVVRDGSWKDIRIDIAEPNRKPLPKSDIRQIHIPLGPVGIFGASNFPLAFSVAGGDTASALAAGCPVIAKGHPLHPGTSELIAKAILAAINKCNLPDGVFSLLQGKSHDVGMAIVQNHLISAIGFTGSFGGGKAIFEAANARNHPIPVFAEMGSSNPVFILPQALEQRKKEISKGLINSLNLGVGQFCTNPGLVITDDSQAMEEFLFELNSEIKNAAPGVMLGEGIKRNYERGVSRLKENEDVEHVNESPASSGKNAVNSNIFSTEVQSFINNPSLAHEIFGPTTLHIKASKKYQMMQLAELLEGHLTATIHGTEEELEEYKELIEILERKVGRLIFNGYPTGVEVCHAMVHGGPFPATTFSQSTSVGTAAIKRFARPICFQDFPSVFLPPELKNKNILGVLRMINGNWTKQDI
jgi:NADP-dependent aldehyde dehydrogenase